MKNNDPLLKIRFDGKAIGTGKIPVSHLLLFLTNWNKALQRTGRVLHGQQSRNIKNEMSLDLVLLSNKTSAYGGATPKGSADPA